MRCFRCGYQDAITWQSCPRCGLLLPSTEQKAPATHAEVGVPSTPALPFRAVASLASASSPSEISVPKDRSLQKGRYLLIEQQEKREWSPTTAEVQWLAQDKNRGGYITMCEVVLPLSGSPLHRFFLSAARVLIGCSHHEQSQQLLDCFMENGRGYFIFEHLAGESIQARVQRGETLSEEEAIACYRQMASALLFFSQQHPVIVHGAIQPDYVINVGTRWMLTHVPVLTAGGALQFLSSEEQQERSCIPMHDLSALAEVMYYSLTGGRASADHRMQQVQLTNAKLSPPLTAILMKGIHPALQERFQHPSEVIQELMQCPESRQEEAREIRSRPAQEDRQRKRQQFFPSSTTQDLHSRKQPHVLDQPEPKEENAPPSPYRGAWFLDALVAFLWSFSILCGATILLLLAR